LRVFEFAIASQAVPDQKRAFGWIFLLGGCSFRERKRRWVPSTIILAIYCRPRHPLVALVLTARRFMELGSLSSCCGLYPTPHAVHMIHQLWYLTTLHLIIAHLTSPCVFMMSLASNRVYSLFAWPRHRGVVTSSAALHNRG
jgi:hypothetical protein